jgi:hypothetical protein
VDGRTVALRYASPAVFAPRVEPQPAPFRKIPAGFLFSIALGAVLVAVLAASRVRSRRGQPQP